MSTPDFRPARPEDFPAIRALLMAEGLPSEDVDVGQTGRFHVALLDGHLLGCVGLELYGADALLRSVAVAYGARHRGLGRNLVGIAERDATLLGAHRLFLLTTSAADYFFRLGYQRFDRNAVPALLRDSSQFSLLCPASATCMMKSVAVRQ
ncbi:GNAT family N-acetyltransferase [Ralstonia pickettii]|uniref:GNAT family N-acetyltransferase n=1 Tax=Ralstonia pickettii TaxID=329 RepID=A0A7X2HKB3_RALPI|nr:arsenic resistance N-acetyltransferase ArsN2 [Ralstonia pickettii]MRS98065.1 GNAT family N-acetyltransferase [Ralstonia pickettii]